MKTVKLKNPPMKTSNNVNSNLSSATHKNELVKRMNTFACMESKQIIRFVCKWSNLNLYDFKNTFKNYSHSCSKYHNINKIISYKSIISLSIQNFSLHYMQILFWVLVCCPHLGVKLGFHEDEKNIFICWFWDNLHFLFGVFK